MSRPRKIKGVLFSPGSAPGVRMKPQAAKLWRKLEKAARKRIKFHGKPKS
jgi:hypothetical protein